MDGRKALAKAFGDYIDAHHWTQAQVAAMDGPSTTTQTKVRGTDEPISRQTLKQIDSIMGWPPDTAAGVLNGTPSPSASIDVAWVDDDGEDRDEFGDLMTSASVRSDLVGLFPVLWTRV